MNAFICYITCIILFICYIIKLLLHYIYLYINYSNNLFNVPNLFLGRLDVLFTNFMMETKKAFNRLYYIYSDIS